ncbi:hypothetical protein MBLNU457_g2939t1 [Dothideomycetes sp. NU457]
MTPRRRRDHSDVRDTGSIPLAISTEHSPTPREADSPRTQVAERLEILDIANAPAVAVTRHQSPSRLAATRKRMKRDGDGDIQTPEGSPTKRRRKVDEVAETPGAYHSFRSTPPVSPTRQNAPTTDSPGRTPITPPKHTTSGLGLEIDSDTAENPTSSPSVPRAMTGTPSPQRTSPKDFDDEPSSSPTALTWQDVEITGHEIDASADDDGEGINGIGFKPTAAMAEARKARRKQQVDQWRAREAREARQRRIEKRKGSTGSSGPRSKNDADNFAKRAVRFLDADNTKP